jgi:hypothetical protein
LGCKLHDAVFPLRRHLHHLHRSPPQAPWLGNVVLAIESSKGKGDGNLQVGQVAKSAARNPMANTGTSATKTEPARHAVSA